FGLNEAGDGQDLVWRQVHISGPVGQIDLGRHVVELVHHVLQQRAGGGGGGDVVGGPEQEALELALCVVRQRQAARVLRDRLQVLDRYDRFRRDGGEDVGQPQALGNRHLVGELVVGVDQVGNRVRGLHMGAHLIEARLDRRGA